MAYTNDDVKNSLLREEAEGALCSRRILRRTPSSCPVCRQRIQNHARGEESWGLQWDSH